MNEINTNNVPQINDANFPVPTKRTLQQLNLIDDFLFFQVMQDPDICKELIEEILNIKIEKIVLSESEKTIKLDLDSHGVRFDVYVKGSDGTVYEVEMQNGGQSHIPRRSRYYQSMIDGASLDAGKEYKTLPEVYVIFICNFDYFDQGLHIYSFDYRCTQMLNLEYGDGTHRIYLNTQGTKDDVSPAIADFLRYVEDSTESTAAASETDLVRNIHNRVRKVKRSKRLEADFMTLQEKYNEYLLLGEARGEARGIAKEKIEIAAAMKKEGIASVLISKCTGLSEEEIENLPFEV